MEKRTRKGGRLVENRVKIGRKVRKCETEMRGEERNWRDWGEVREKGRQ